MLNAIFSKNATSFFEKNLIFCKKKPRAPLKTRFGNLGKLQKKRIIGNFAFVTPLILPIFGFEWRWRTVPQKQKTDQIPQKTISFQDDYLR